MAKGKIGLITEVPQGVYWFESSRGQSVSRETRALTTQVVPAIVNEVTPACLAGRNGDHE